MVGMNNNKIMTRQYISDIISLDEVKKWKPGNRILIRSQTGSGKSEFLKTVLYDYAKSIDKQILLMSNRILLKKQNEFDLQDKQDFITLENYQSFESKILKGVNDIVSLFEPYCFICEDELHYPFADGIFSDNTDLLIRHIKDTPKDKIFIFLTATPEVLLNYQPNFDFVYNLPKDYSYIKNIYFYDKDKTVNDKSIETIIKNIPKDEKVLYFGSDVNDIYDLSTRFENASFICSQGNKLKKKSDINTMLEIEQESKFSTRLLFATKVLYNGVNIKDPALKHIIIDTCDIVTFVQMLGRKRSMFPEDQITLYVNNYHKVKLGRLRDAVIKQLKKLDDKEKIISGNLAFQYPDYDFKKDDTAYKTNIAKHENYLFQLKFLNKLLNSKYEDSFARYICTYLEKDIRYTKDVFFEFEKKSFKEVIDIYLGVKMFKDTQEVFKERFFRQLFVTKKTNYKLRGLNAINKILAEDNLSYQIINRQQKSGSSKGSSYWILQKGVK